MSCLIILRNGHLTSSWYGHGLNGGGGGGGQEERSRRPEAGFLDVIGTKVFLLAIHSHRYYEI